MPSPRYSVGILAYGSLIDDPGGELGPIILTRIQGVETPFPAEFARSSRTRGDAPTLIPYPSAGQPVKSEILIVDTAEDLATDMLWRRETRREGSSERYIPPGACKPNAVRVERLDDFPSVDVVLYTSIGANISPLTGERLAALAIESVAKAKPGMDGISYLMAAKKNGIETRLSAAYEDHILACTRTADLGSALKLLQHQDERPAG